MNLSAFDQVAEYVGQLRRLQEARDNVQYQGITVTASHRVGDGRSDITKLTSLTDCRRVLVELLDQTISGVKAALKTYNVDVDN